jgi:hypothetical protein
VSLDQTVKPFGIDQNIFAVVTLTKLPPQRVGLLLG